MPLLSRSVVYHNINNSDRFKLNVESDYPVVIDGVEVYDLICPVSNLTGNRTNPVDLLKMALPDKDYRFINQILQEVPTIPSDSNLSDEDRVSMLTMRLVSGTPAEDEFVTRQLMKVVDVLFPDKAYDLVPSDSISFASQDVPEPSE